MRCPTWVDARFRVHVLLWTVASALAYGLVAAIIPNPVFGREIPPTLAAVAVWLLAAPLMGVIGATYSSPWASAASTPIILIGGHGAPAATAPSAPALAVEDERATWLGGLASFGTFLAIGCPVCNKIALLLLGTSGALSVWAPIQPVLGAVSLGLLVVTVVWRLRLRAGGATCAPDTAGRAS
jgi:hypothetical protein